jgi:SHS2 domain-containing protein
MRAHAILVRAAHLLALVRRRGRLRLSLIPAWETFEHEADVGLVVRGHDGPELFANAALALVSLVCEVDTVVTREQRELAGEAEDTGSLLVDWLNDVVFLIQGERLLCSRFEFPHWSEASYRAVACGEPIDAARHDFQDLVKAATYHGLDVVATAEGLEARVILDV